MPITDEELMQRQSEEISNLRTLLHNERQSNGNRNAVMQIEILKDKLEVQQKLWEDIVAGMKEKVRKQQEEIEKLHQRIKSVDDDDEVIVLPTNHKKLRVGQYVTMKKYEKLQKQVAMLTEQLNNKL